MLRLRIAEIKNMTKSPIRIINNKGEVIVTFKSEGAVRLIPRNISDGEIGTYISEKHVMIPLTRTVYDEEKGVPPKSPLGKIHIFYIVPPEACLAYMGRTDLLIPSQPVKGEKGEVIGYKSLSLCPYHMDMSWSISIKWDGKHLKKTKKVMEEIQDELKKEEIAQERSNLLKS